MQLICSRRVISVSEGPTPTLLNDLDDFAKTIGYTNAGDKADRALTLVTRQENPSLLTVSFASYWRDKAVVG